MTIRAFSFGGGWQSMAALVLAAQKQIDYQTFLFANVGNDSEYPGTIRYVDEVAKPYAAAHGLELVEITPTKRGKPITLYQEVTDPSLRSIAIPLRDETGNPARRSCTKHFKIIPIAREIKRRGATKANPAVLGMGISLDEFHRMRTDSPIAWQRYEYPLIDMRLTRDMCGRIIADAGLPIPPKSACWFCPFHRTSDWRIMKEQEPSLFMNAVVFEADILAKRKRNGFPVAYLSIAGKPLSEAFEGDQAIMDFDGLCDSGQCFT